MSATYNANINIIGNTTVTRSIVAGNLGGNTNVSTAQGLASISISNPVAQVWPSSGTSMHSAMVMTNGTVRVCGLNGDGQLGQNDTVTRSTVVPVLGICSQAIAVACGRYHTAILLNNATCVAPDESHRNRLDSKEN